MKIAILTGSTLHNSAYDAFSQITKKVYYNKAPKILKKGTIRIIFEILKSFFLCFTIPKNDVYLLNSPSALFLGYLKKTLRKENCKLIIRVNDSMFYSNSYIKKKFYKILAKKLDGAFLISKMLKKGFREYNKKAIIRYVYTPVKNKKYFKIKPDFKNKGILCIGIKSRHRKGTKISVKIAQNLKEEVYILGSYWKTKEIYNKYKKINNIHFPGFVNPEQYMKKSLFFLHPSRFDAGATAVIEAMAAGLIPIVSYKTGNKDIVNEINPSLVIHSFNYLEYLNTIEEMKTLSVYELKKISIKCKKIAEKYNEKKSSKVFKQKFKSMIQEINNKES